MHRIVVLALDGVIPFELGTPARIFGAATGADGGPLYEIVTCTLDGGPVRTDADFSIVAGHEAEALTEADTVVIPASRTLGPIATEGRLPEPLAEAIGRIRPGTRLVSICTAAYVLAAAGLLDDRAPTSPRPAPPRSRPAAQPWRRCSRLRSRSIRTWPSARR